MSTLRVHAIEHGRLTEDDSRLNRILFDPNTKCLSLSLEGQNLAYEVTDQQWTAIMDIVKQYATPAKDPERVLDATWDTIAEVNAKIADSKRNT